MLLDLIHDESGSVNNLIQNESEHSLAKTVLNRKHSQQISGLNQQQNLICPEL